MGVYGVSSQSDIIYIIINYIGCGGVANEFDIIHRPNSYNMYIII